ncbi:hypothetical protein BJ138DRAFT_1156579 [Hygrophoropsis aurantiaca]|uniref:Uncharacterized protein n=1 Tax=Hygrophoropsis aurantiaca TaxID=72124 RepID=A0ACB8A5V2_9AGAM|nr:hypothetical protein BJ138DRAFT_1156579 [Hygrophoropsis aurantiaca]
MLTLDPKPHGCRFTGRWTWSSLSTSSAFGMVVRILSTPRSTMKIVFSLRTMKTTWRAKMMVTMNVSDLNFQTLILIFISVISVSI